MQLYTWLGPTLSWHHSSFSVLQFGHTSLHSAAIAGHVPVLKTLLNNGAIIDARTKVSVSFSDLTSNVLFVFVLLPSRTLYCVKIHTVQYAPCTRIQMRPSCGYNSAIADRRWALDSAARRGFKRLLVCDTTVIRPQCTTRRVYDTLRRSTTQMA